MNKMWNKKCDVIYIKSRRIVLAYILKCLLIKNTNTLTRKVKSAIRMWWLKTKDALTRVDLDVLNLDCCWCLGLFLCGFCSTSVLNRWKCAKSSKTVNIHLCALQGIAFKLYLPYVSWKTRQTPVCSWFPFQIKSKFAQRKLMCHC